MPKSKKIDDKKVIEKKKSVSKKKSPDKKVYKKTVEKLKPTQTKENKKTVEKLKPTEELKLKLKPTQTKENKKTVEKLKPIEVPKPKEDKPTENLKPKSPQRKRANSIEFFDKYGYDIYTEDEKRQEALGNLVIAFGPTELIKKLDSESMKIPNMANKFNNDKKWIRDNFKR